MATCFGDVTEDEAEGCAGAFASVTVHKMVGIHIDGWNYCHFMVRKKSDGQIVASTAGFASDDSAY